MEKIKKYFYNFLILIFIIFWTFPILKIYDYFKPALYSKEEIIKWFDDLDAFEKKYLDSLQSKGLEHINLIPNTMAYKRNTVFYSELLTATNNDSIYIDNKIENYLVGWDEELKYEEIFDTLYNVSALLNSEIKINAIRRIIETIDPDDNDSKNILDQIYRISINECEYLMKAKYSYKSFKERRILLLIDWWEELYTMNIFLTLIDLPAFEESFTIFTENFLKYIFDYFNDDPIFTFYAITYLSQFTSIINSEDYLSEITSIFAIELPIIVLSSLEENRKKFKYSSLEYSYLRDAINFSKLSTLTALENLQPINNVLEYYESALDDIEKANPNYEDYIYDYRGYYLSSIDALANLQIRNDKNRLKKSEILYRIFGDRFLIDWFFNTNVKNEMIISDEFLNPNYVLSLIEKNKSRIFKEELEINWITEIPQLNEDEIGINYIVGYQSILGQIYFPNKKSEIFYTHLKDVKNIWKKIETKLRYHPDKSLVEKLRNKIIPPKFHDLIENKKIIISADGILTEMPFQYILGNISAKSIKLIPGFSFLNREELIKNNLCAVSASNPDYDEVSNSYLFSDVRSNIKSIPFVDKEIESISKIYHDIYPDKKSIIQKDVTEKWIKNNISSFDIIHFAAHSIGYHPAVEEAGILLSKTDYENGILTPSEIRELKLNNSLIFLSSCESNIGEFYPGEGMNSLANSFLNAGAKSVIASLWNVYDEPTKELVSIFYKIYLENKNPEESLYRAQKIFSERHPNYSPQKLFPFIIITN